jgi:DNA-binding CsgD family transcriptional regulator
VVLTPDSGLVAFAAIRRLTYLPRIARFTGKQVKDALALIDVMRSVTRPRWLAEQVVGALAQIVPGEFVGYNERELISHDLLVVAEAPIVTRSRHVSDAVSAFCAEYPLSMERHHAASRALRISDIASSRQLHRLDYYDQALQPLGIEHEVRLWLSAPSGIARYYFISRRKEDGDFSDSNREMLDLLRPFLVAVHEQFDVQAPTSENADGLTSRETEILGWVARGKTNKEIAGLLIVSPHTVRKHLEHVYEKLRVNSRTAAVARVFAPLN